MKCFSCKRIFIKEMKARTGNAGGVVCPWCKKPQASRQSLRSFKPRKK